MRLLATAGIALCFPWLIRAQGAAVGAIEGIIADSIHARPLAGVRVQAIRVDAPDDSTLVTVADVLGRFRFERLHPGRYALSILSPFLDSLEFGGPATQLSVVARGVAHVDLAFPSGTTLRSAACPGLTLLSRTGALVGHVSDADTERPLGGASVLVAWSDLRIDSVTHAATSEERFAQADADSMGSFRLCGVPTGEWLVVQVHHANRAGAVLRLSIGDAVGVLVRNFSFSAAGSRPLGAAGGETSADTLALPAIVGTASVSGTVRVASGQPVVGAQVRVIDGGRAARTDGSGRFSLTALPAGTHDIEVKVIGYRVERRPMELRNGVTLHLDVELERAVMLDSVAVVARRVRYPEFERRKREAMSGYFRDEAELSEHHAHNTSELVWTIPGFRVSGQGADAKVVSARGRVSGGACGPVIVVDYLRIERINDVPPSTIGAMEFYPSQISAPMPFRSPCGTIMIWTKR